MKAALSLDLDNKWSYMKTHGDSGWDKYPSYLNEVVPLALDMLAQLGLRITFFIVGRDASRPENSDALSQISRSGHEVANHSYEHEPWMHRRSEAEIDLELARAEESIERVTGQRPVGFRGPGFTVSPAILRTLVRRGYAYDASTLPTFIGPLARAYYFRSAKLKEAERTARHDLFGNFADVLQSNRPHMIHVNGRSVAELPVTTMPGLRLPIHIRLRIIYRIDIAGTGSRILCDSSTIVQTNRHRAFDLVASLRLLKWKGSTRAPIFSGDGLGG